MLKYYKAACWIGVGIVCAVTAKNSLVYVRKGHRAVIFNKLNGVTGVLNEGLHFVKPWLDFPIMFNIQPKTKNFKVVVKAIDSKEYEVELCVLYMPDKEYLKQIYLYYGPEYDKLILFPVVKEALEQIAVKCSPSQILSSISNDVKKLANEKAGKHFIIVDDVAIIYIK